MKLIPLTRGKFAMVDNADFEWLNQWKWFAHKAKENKYYARRWDNDIKRGVSMHRELLGITDPKIFVDHRDGNSLNNQRENLREATCSQNNSNRITKKNGASRFLGVFKHLNMWRADVTSNSKTIHCGTFTTEEDAAIAYNKAAIQFHGEFAKLNIIDLNPTPNDKQ